PGVGDATIFGEREYSMRLWIDPELAMQRGVTAGDISAAIQEQNLQVAAGQVGQLPLDREVSKQFTLDCRGQLLTEEEFANVIIRTDSEGRVTRLGDIARIELGAKTSDIDGTQNGHASVMLGVFQLPGSNGLEVAELVYRAIDNLSKSFPPGVAYQLAVDTTPFISESVHEVLNTLRDAIILVVIVVLIFLQSWRATIIPLIAIPVSLIGTFAVMAVLGFSLNNLSLFGLVLAIGIVVDDAIIVVENVEHHMEEGLSPREASYRAMEEVSGPVVAVALVLSAVFIPTAFISGITGMFFQQFALTIATSTIISAFNSLTLSPALSAILLKPKGTNRDPLTWILDATLGFLVFRPFNFLFRLATEAYVRGVWLCLRLSLVVLVVYGGLLFLTYQLFLSVPTGFIPESDKGYLMGGFQLPDNASRQRTDAVAEQIEKLILGEPELDENGHIKEIVDENQQRKQVRHGGVDGVKSVSVISGMSLLSSSNSSNMGTMFLILDPFAERGEKGRTADVILNEIRGRLAPHMDEHGKIQGVTEGITMVFGAPPVDGLGSTGGFKLQIQDRRSVGLPTLQKYTEELVAAGNAQGTGLVGLYTSFRAGVETWTINVDRDRAKAMGVPLSEIFTALQTYLGSTYINDFIYLGRAFQVKAQVDARYRDQIDDVARLYVRNTNGEMVPLGSVLTVTSSTGPIAISKYNMYPTASITGMGLPGVSSGQQMEKMEELAAQILPDALGYEWTETAFMEKQAGNTAMYIFALAVVLVFLVLAAQYESWSLPMAVILVVPMCLLSSLFGVDRCGLDMNIFTQIGFIVLIGLASKNAILIVEFAKMKQESGMSGNDATLAACRLHLRPILMTSLAFILGVVPLMFGKGAGWEMRYTLGVAVFFGMLGVTLFGIFLTPVFYYVIQWFTHKRKKPETMVTTGNAKGEKI
ncbi:MAG: efflux RND transporter permease subunit, partial [Planctomycetia bacterium]|nr:efflux RND transporter permease subunit [Planctomycetia bacterium]